MAPTQRRTFRLADLREKCKILASVVESSGSATEAEVRAVRPGGAENPDRGTWGWLHYHANLVAFNARMGSTTGPRGGTQTEDPEQIILRALRRAPETLEPVAAGSHGVPLQLVVYPKGLDALFWFHEKDLLLARLVDAHQQLRARAADDDAALLERVVVEVAYQNTLLVWVATSDGPWLPFDPYRDPRPTAPAWLSALDPRDVVGVVRRFQDVNGGRLRALSALLPSQRADGADAPRASWSVFASTVAAEMSVPVSTLLRDWTLGEVLAQVHLSANAKHEAVERARVAAQDGDD
jgi:hypothetical protein